MHCTSSAANQTAAAPTRISRILQNQLEAAEMAKKTEKKASIIAKDIMFYFIWIIYLMNVVSAAAAVSHSFPHFHPLHSHDRDQ